MVVDTVLQGVDDGGGVKGEVEDLAEILAPVEAVVVDDAEAWVTLH